MDPNWSFAARYIAAVLTGGAIASGATLTGARNVEKGTAENIRTGDPKSGHIQPETRLYAHRFCAPNARIKPAVYGCPGEDRGADVVPVRHNGLTPYP